MENLEISLKECGPVTFEESTGDIKSGALEALADGTVSVTDFDREKFANAEAAAGRVREILKDGVEKWLAAMAPRGFLFSNMKEKLADALKAYFSSEGIAADVNVSDFKLTEESEKKHSDFCDRRNKAFFSNVIVDRPYYPDQDVRKALGLDSLNPGYMNQASDDAERESNGFKDKYCRQCGSKRKGEERFCEQCGAQFKR